jgi:hypothetical protein
MLADKLLVEWQGAVGQLKAFFFSAILIITNFFILYQAAIDCILL